MNKLPTVTVAISAYNEGKNILTFLNSVLMQNSDNFILKEIWVHSDGSRDNTVKLIRSLKSKKIKIWDHKDRVGKSYRLNTIYSNLKTDLLVQSDADVRLGNENVIKNLITPLIKNSNVAMAGGNPIPVSGLTFIEKAINLTCKAYIALRSEVRGGDNIFSADGRLLVLKKELVKKIHVPTKMIANDAYAYYCCLNLGYKYRFVPSSIVYFRSPQNLKDHLRQNIRFESAERRMKRYFSSELVEKESKIPKKLLLKNLFKQFLTMPIHAFYIFIVNQYCRFMALKSEKDLTGKWLIADSTKELLKQNVFFNYRKTLFIAAYNLGKLFGLHKQIRSVLCYHSISDSSDRYAVSFSNFKKQIEKISKYADFISLDEAINGNILKPSVCLTFDDGFEDLLEVLPITKKYKIPVTIFVLSDPKNANRKEMDTSGKLLSFKQIKFLISQGWTVGCHSATHADFGKLTKKKLIEEIKHSKLVLERKLGIEIKYFAYPKGRWQVAQEVVKQAGFKAAFSVRGGCITKNEDNFILPRAVIDKTHSLAEFPAVFSPSTFLLRKATDRFGLWEKFLQADSSLMPLIVNGLIISISNLKLVPLFSRRKYA